MSKEFKRMQQLAGIKEITVSPPETYYALLYIGDDNFYIIAYSKKSMIDQLNKIYREISASFSTPYSLEDMDEDARMHMGLKSDSYISDDFALVTDDKQYFDKNVSYLEIPPKRYQSPADVNEIITRGPTQIYKSIPDQGLYKIKNFPQGDAYNPKVKEILDKIAQDAYGEIPTPGSIDYEEYLDSINYHMTITLQSRANVYVYISDDGMEPSIYDSLEYFSDGYKTEEEWGVEDWEQI